MKSPFSYSLTQRLPSRLQRSLGSLRTQLIFWNVVALSLLLGCLGVVCRYVTFSVIMKSIDQELDRGVRVFQRQPPNFPFDRERRFGATPGHGGAERPPRRPPDTSNPYHPHLFNAEGRSEIAEDTRPVWDKDALARTLKGKTIHKTVMVDGAPVRIISAPRVDWQGRKGGAVQRGFALKEVYLTISGVDTTLLLLIPIGLLGAGWLGAALTNRILKRLHRMTQAAGRIGAEDLTRRLPVSGNDEFSELAETFNGLLGRLDQAFQEQKQLLYLQQRFTADASHELKTPLTIIKGRACLGMGRASTDEKSRHTFHEINKTTDMMAQLVQDLLLLARSDEGQSGRHPMDLLAREVLERAIDQVPNEEGATVSLSVEPEDLMIHGNEVEMVRLFRNLLDNAVRYTPADGSVTVTACGSAENIIVTITDTGIGIAPEHLPHLGERFYRVDASRTRPTGGTGLGLSICRSIVKAHGGTLTFESVLDSGTTVTVTLPRL